ncbi:MAG: peptidoglycan bridge formation glycyltransferase FemA/FemB family protein [Candidatus Veblenbacteria bacterium]|nr:peptidoglycan bridge formation glycyltransferase FemA/FemB family protein [Candidatus Veblenbacteria bacterium]
MPWRELADEALVWEFVRSLAPRPGLFLQSPAWSRFQQELGNVTKVLGWFDGAQLIGLSSLSWRRLPLGWGYWCCSKGPVWQTGVTPQAQAAALLQLYTALRAPKTLFVRLEPEFPPPAARRTIDGEPRATTVVDLSCSEAELFARMHEKTRYNIRLAERKGLTFRWGDLQEFAGFWSLLQETARRERFRTHNTAHYRTLLELFGAVPFSTPELACRLGLVEYQGELLAASLVVICNRQVTYLHGASSRTHHELMAPHLLHGAALRQLQAAGCVTYDLWGIQPPDGSLSAWVGFTRFKLGFGGESVESPGTFDYPLARLSYLLYGIIRRLRRGGM